MIFYWILTILLNIGTIYYFIFYKKIFSPMNKEKWIILCCAVVVGFILSNFLERSGLWRPLLFQEELSNLKKEDGILRITHRLKNNTYYIEKEDGTKIKLNFVHISMRRFNEYIDKAVIIWKKDRYVYQMEMKDNVVFSINEANDGLFIYNVQGVIGDSVWFWVIMSITFMAMYTKFI